MTSSNSDDSRTEAIRTIAPTQRVNAIDFFVASGPDAGRSGRLLKSTIRIGTAADNDIVLSDKAVSRHHAQVEFTPEGLLLRDLDSTNGTFVGQLRISQGYLVGDMPCIMGYTRLLLRRSDQLPQSAAATVTHLGELIGSSPQMLELYNYIQMLAPTAATILIQGESGCGKELVARTLHDLSGRKGPLVVFDASVTDAEMVRNDLFGHVKGAFTGAAGSREGAFRRAEGGTLFIDEIGELPLDLQPRLLRALESREVTPIGADKPIPVDVRVVAATHRDLQAMVCAGQFRTDLFYRLSVVPLRVPALREITEDIPPLVDAFLKRLEQTCHVMPDALQALQQYAWPGNVRELRNVIERAAILCQDGCIRVHDLHLPGELQTAQTELNAPADSGEAHTDSNSPSRSKLRELEQRMILDTLVRNGDNKTAAARELGIPLSTLKRRLKDYQAD
jgi:DNA-binding NtrC family response regulator